MSEAPAELWVRPTDAGHWYETSMPDEPDAVRYVRADLYEAALALAERRVEAVVSRLEVVREADYPR